MINKRFAILLLFMGIAFNSYSQYYSKSFLIDNLNTVSDNLTILDNKIYTIGISPDTSLAPGIGIKSYISKFDNNGILTDYNTFRPEQHFTFTSTFYYGKSIIIDNKIVTCGYTEDTNTFLRNYLICFYDTNLSMSKYFVSPTGITNGSLTSITSINNHYYATGKRNNPRQCILLKLDTLGNKIRELNYNIVSIAQFNQAQSIIALDSGDLLMVIGGYKEYPDWGEHYKLTYKTTLIRTDSLGGQKWQWTDTSNNGQAAYSFQKTSDGGYISCGSYVGTRVLIREVPSGVLLEDYALYMPYVVKWNSDFTKQWENYDTPIDTGYRQGVLLDIKELPDGSFLGCGYYSEGSVFGYLVKIDASGNTIWSKQYRTYEFPETFSQHRLYDLDILDNGDIVAVGEINPQDGISIPQQGWLLRVDSNGCIVDSNWCGWNSVEVEPQPMAWQATNELLLYPNPANDIINITYKNSTLNLSDELKITILDIQGREVFNLVNNYKDLLQIDISDFERGIYFIKINTEDNKVVSNGKFIKE